MQQGFFFFFFLFLDVFMCSSQLEKVDVFKANSTVLARDELQHPNLQETSHSPASKTAFMDGKQICHTLEMVPHFSPCMCNNYPKLISLF